MGYSDPDKRREFQRQWFAKRRAKQVARFGGMCQRCGSTKDLEFAHRERGTKIIAAKGFRGAVSWSWALERIELELKKCDLLCRECHMKDTSEENTTPIVHGTWQGYKRTKNPCRCAACTKANAAYEHARR